MASTMIDGQSALSAEMVQTFQKMFVDFQERAEKLSNAYGAMQEDFRKINLELDKKNSELTTSLAREEEMQTYLDSILQCMENGVIGIDVNGTITHFNSAAASATGYESSDLVGKSYSNVFTSESEPELVKLLRGGMASTVRNEKVLWHRDGHPVPVTYLQSILKDRTGALLGAVEIFTDITKIKALEAEMQRTRTMAALGEMSATVAHEIRNPLGAMGMWAALLERDLGGEDPRRVTVGKIIEGLARLNKIVSNLLVFTRPVKAELRKVDLVATVNEMVDFVKIEIERLGQDVTISEVYPSFPVFAVADPEKIGQIILNLCLNSIQAMQGAGGALQIEISLTTGAYVVIAVNDNGCGIPRDEIGKIFDPFFTTKENGTGLGLAIVKRFIEFHSGYIDVSSECGEGTTVKVFIPQLKE